MGVYKYLRKLYEQPKKNIGDLYKERLIEWRKEGASTRIEKPTRLDRARSLGYKAKPGIIVVRQKVMRNKRQRPNTMAGRRPKANRRKKIVKMNYQHISEMRANKKFPNCEVLGSYWLAEDGKNKWFEIILVDRTHPSILSDPKYNWISLQRGRAARSLTSAGKKSRGLRSNKGKGAEKLRPSIAANQGRGK